MKLTIHEDLTADITGLTSADVMIIMDGLKMLSEQKLKAGDVMGCGQAGALVMALAYQSMAQAGALMKNFPGGSTAQGQPHTANKTAGDLGVTGINPEGLSPTAGETFTQGGAL